MKFTVQTTQQKIMAGKMGFPKSPTMPAATPILITKIRLFLIIVGTPRSSRYLSKWLSTWPIKTLIKDSEQNLTTESKVIDSKNSLTESKIHDFKKLPTDRSVIDLKKFPKKVFNLAKMLNGISTSKPVFKKNWYKFYLCCNLGSQLQTVGGPEYPSFFWITFAQRIDPAGNRLAKSSADEN